MLRTLFVVPHEIAGLPVFGFGWILIALAVALAVRLFLGTRTSGRKTGATAGKILQQEGLVWAIAAAVFAFVMPAVELTNVAGDSVGIAVRGYGVLLLVGIVTAVMAAAYRAGKAGMNPDLIYGLAPWTFIGGIVGARLFYVIQYRDEYIASTWSETIGNALAFTGGGLVVYGGFLGGFAASAFYLLRHRMPLLKLGDAIVPCIFIGLMFGRLGCLMNGCCYGGRCEEGPTAIEFPAGSPVYQDQLVSGTLLGIEVDDATRRITNVRGGTVGEAAGIRIGQRVEQIQADASFLRDAPLDIPADQALVGVAALIDGDVYRWSPNELPDRALPVRAAQVISSLTGATMALVLWSLGWWLDRQSWRRSGTLMFVGFAAYAVVRFVLEIVRVDEGGQFGTSFSISQWVSLCVLAASVGGLIWLYAVKPSTANANGDEPNAD